MVKAARGAILVTGASGFVGKALVDYLQALGRSVVGVVRNDPPPPGCLRGPELSGVAQWDTVLRAAAVVVHTAGRAHLPLNDAGAVAACRAVNVEGTLNLARQAAAAGVRRFVFLSTIKVNGERTHPGTPFSADDPPAPEDVYGRSKAEAEEGLRALATRTGMEVVIIRPPLVYGPGVKANFLGMVRWLRLGVPLPLGAVTENRRSLVALDNLLDLIAVCIDHPAAANEIFLVSDGEDLSTADMLRRLARALEVPARLLPVPVWLLQLAAGIAGQRAMIGRLCGSLQADITKTRRLLGWHPAVGVDEGFRRVSPQGKGGLA